MGTRIVSACVKNPITGWHPCDDGFFFHEPFDDTACAIDTFADSLCGGSGVGKLRDWHVRTVGDCTVMRLEVTTRYQREHPESNQACIEAEITLLEEPQSDSEMFACQGELP